MKLYMSWFTIGRLVKLAKKPSKVRPYSVVLLKTLISPRSEYTENSWGCYFPLWYILTLPWIRTIPVKQGLSWRPTWKSLPNMMMKRKRPSFLTSWKYEVAAYAQSLIREISHGQIFSSILLFEPWIRYPLDHLDRPDWYWNINRDSP